MIITFHSYNKLNLITPYTSHPNIFWSLILLKNLFKVGKFYCYKANRQIDQNEHRTYKISNKLDRRIVDCFRRLSIGHCASYVLSINLLVWSAFRPSRSLLSPRNSLETSILNQIYPCAVCCATPFR